MRLKTLTLVLFSYFSNSCLIVCMEKLELNDFYNHGFGWICKHCERELQMNNTDKKTSRLMTEGEAESKNPKLSSPALAKWADAAQRILTCPRCGITELADKH